MCASPGQLSLLLYLTIRGSTMRRWLVARPPVSIGCGKCASAVRAGKCHAVCCYRLPSSPGAPTETQPSSRLLRSWKRYLPMNEGSGSEQQLRSAAERTRTIIHALHPARDYAIGNAFSDAARRLRHATSLAVRSSAVGEDSQSRAFAGHAETVLGVAPTLDAIARAVVLVWASRFSDAFLLAGGVPQPEAAMAVLLQPRVGGAVRFLGRAYHPPRRPSACVP